MVVQGHVIVKGMKMRDPWKKRTKQIAKDFTALTNTHDLACPDFNLSTLESKIDTLRDRQHRRADKMQGLFSDRSAKPCPQRIPTYSGSPSEDFITFKDKFEKAAEDNRTSKTDQLEKLRETLTGNAASLHTGWSQLTSPGQFWRRHLITHLNFRLGVMKSTQPLTDKSIETDPNKAATWFLQYKKAI